jgi:hypothetical protein
MQKKFRECLLPFSSEYLGEEQKLRVFENGVLRRIY